jgi:nucleoside phosphorylase
MTAKILLVTVTKVEALAVLDVFSTAIGKKWERKNIKGKIYYDLGKINNTEIYMVQSQMGTSGVGASLSTVSAAIEALHPSAIIMVGIAFGLRPDKQKLGEILVSKQLMAYDSGKIKGTFIPRGDRSTCSESLLDKFTSGDMDWQGAKVHFGLVLSGEKLVADEAFREDLLAIEREAIGGEMEGVGLYVAARKEKVDWIVVKGICDWAEREKDDTAQPIAARNAASFVLHVLQQSTFEKPKRADIILEGMEEDCDEKCVEHLLAVLTGMFKLEPKDIRILHVRPGSIVVELELSEIAVNRLFEAAVRHDFRLVALGVKSVVFYGTGSVNLQEHRENEFVKYNPERGIAEIRFPFSQAAERRLATRLEAAQSQFSPQDPFVRSLEQELNANLAAYVQLQLQDLAEIKQKVDVLSRQIGRQPVSKSDFDSFKNALSRFHEHVDRTMSLVEHASSSQEEDLAYSLFRTLRALQKDITRVEDNITRKPDNLKHINLGTTLGVLTTMLRRIEEYEVELKELVRRSLGKGF